MCRRVGTTDPGGRLVWWGLEGRRGGEPVNARQLAHCVSPVGARIVCVDVSVERQVRGSLPGGDWVGL